MEHREQRIYLVKQILDYKFKRLKYEKIVNGYKEKKRLKAFFEFPIINQNIQKYINDKSNQAD